MQHYLMVQQLESLLRVMTPLKKQLIPMRKRNKWKDHNSVTQNSMTLLLILETTVPRDNDCHRSGSHMMIPGIQSTFDLCIRHQ